MTNTATGTVGEVATDQVMRDGIVVRPDVDRETAARATKATILQDMVVVDANVIVLAGHIGRHRIGRGQIGVPETNAATQCTVVSNNDVVSDLKVMGKAIHEDAATGISTRDRKAVDAGIWHLRIILGQPKTTGTRRSIFRDHDNARSFLSTEELPLVVLRTEVVGLTRQHRPGALSQQVTDLGPPILQLSGRHLHGVDYG